MGHIPGKYRYDVALARKLLAEGGKPNGFKAILVSTTSGVSSFREIVGAIQAYWSVVGVDVSTEFRDTPAYQEVVRAAANTPGGAAKQMFLQGLSYPTPDPHVGMFRQWHSTQWPPAGQNRGFYKSARVDQLLDQAVTEPDPAKRTAMYREVQEILIEDAPGLAMWTPKYIFGARSNVKDIRLLPTQQIRFAEVSKS